MITGHSAVYIDIEQKTNNNDMELIQFRKKRTWYPLPLGYRYIQDILIISIVII